VNCVAVIKEVVARKGKTNSSARATKRARKRNLLMKKSNSNIEQPPPPLEAIATGRPKFANVVPMLGGGRRAVSRQEAGAMLGVSWKTIERLINRGELQGFKVLGQWRILVSEIDVYVERQSSEQNKRFQA